MFLTLRGSAGLRGRGQNGHSAVHRRIQHLVLPEIFHQDILTGGCHAAGLLELADGIVGDTYAEMKGLNTQQIINGV